MISIGNIAAGGRAKSPMAELVARELIAAGERPSILSRGYARAKHSNAPVVVRDAAGGVRAKVEDSGDEPLMLAQRLDGAIVVVAPDRSRAGATAESLGATVHILDDGFQHLRVARDADIVMLDPRDLNDQVFPSGRLREPIDALSSASAIVVIENDDAERARAKSAVEGLGVRVFGARRRVLPPPVKIGQGTSFLVSGIAGPEQLANAVREAGWKIAGEARYKDHHLYTGQDAMAIAARADECRAAYVVTTAKDLVRLRGVWNSSLALLVAELVLDLDEPDAFRAWLLETVRSARRAS